MKIALYHNLPSGGARRAMVEMAKGLVEIGHTVDEYCPATAVSDFMPLAGYVTKQIRLPFIPRGPFPHRIPGLTPYLTAMRLLNDLQRLTRINYEAARLIDAGHYDLAFTHDCQLAQDPGILRYLSTPTVNYCHHGPIHLFPPVSIHEREHTNVINNLKIAYYKLPRWLYPWLRDCWAINNMRQADTVLTNSYFAREGLLQTYRVDSQVCYLGVDVKRFRPLELEREFFALSVGAVHYYKGYRFLIAALGRIPANLRPALVIAANSAEPEELWLLESLARQLQVRLDVRRVMNDQELVELYNRAAVFVYTPIMEPWGLAMVEALACGTPVVGVREGGVRESVRDGVTGLLVDRDEVEFAQAVIQVLQNQQFSRELGQAATAQVRSTRSWDHTVAHLDQIFARAIAR